MKLSDITVYKDRQWGLHPFTIKVNPSVKTQAFLFRLINDEYFNTSMKNLRAKYGIPENGHSAELLGNFKHNISYLGTAQEMEELQVVNGTYDIQPLRRKMNEDITKLVNHYNYGFDYIWLFFLIITHNAFIEYNPKDHLYIKYESGLQNIKAILNFESDPIVAILIKDNITKEDFKKWIDENWHDNNEEGIVSNLNAIMPKDPVIRGTNKHIEIDEVIIGLLKNNKSSREITDILCEKFSDNEFVTDQTWVNNKISRLKKNFNITNT